MAHYDNFGDFNSRLQNVINSPVEQASNHNVKAVVINLLALATGLAYKVITELRWEDIIENDAEDEIEVKEYLYIRRYGNFLHETIRKKIVDCYTILKYPKLTERIAHISDKDPSYLRNMLVTIRCFGLSLPNIVEKATIMKVYGMEEKEIEQIHSIHFGRKVIQDCGFTKETARRLRQHFRCKSNADILELLFITKEQAKCDIFKINLDARSPFVKIQSKNFNSGHNFQKFVTLSNFLAFNYAGYGTALSSSVKCLLWLSLYNGLKMSSLIQINLADVKNWKSLLKASYGIKIEYLEFDLIMPSALRFFLGMHLIEYSQKPNQPLFITNRGNRISTSSLLRELRKSLKLIGHKQADKFTIDTPLIMWGRRIIELKGDHAPTIRELKKHFGFNSKKQLFDYLQISNPKKGYEIMGNYEQDIYKAITYDI